MSLRELGFSAFERRALGFLVLIIVIASAVRFWQNSHLEQDLKLIGEQSVLSEMESDASNLQGKSLTPVYINTATIVDIESLPGIGPVKAKAILDYREEHGDYKSVEDLQRVYGIGPKTIERLRKWIILGDGL